MYILAKQLCKLLQVVGKKILFSEIPLKNHDKDLLQKALLKFK